MDGDRSFSPVEAHAETESHSESVAVENAKDGAGSRHLNDLETLPPGKLQELYARFNLRMHLGRSRHQQVLDLARHALSSEIPVAVDGFLEQAYDFYGTLRSPQLNFLPLPEDVGVSADLIRHFKLRPGQMIAGAVRLPRDREKHLMLERITFIEGQSAEQWEAPTAFDDLTPVYPEGRIMLENEVTKSISARAIDLLTPLGKGQRGLIVAAPRVGKTILLKEIAKAIRVNHPDIVLIILLVDERPEEVTDLQREVDCQIYNSTFDEN
jgi:transcription termination factor Rho